MRHVPRKAIPILTRLDEVGVHYCVLRGARPTDTSAFPEIDLLVASDDLELFFDTLWDANVLTDLRRTATHFHFHIQEEGPNSSFRLILDVVTEIYYGDSGHLFRVPQETRILASRERERRVWRPSKVYGLLHSILHSLLDKGKPQYPDLSDCAEEYKALPALARKKFKEEVVFWIGTNNCRALIDALAIDVSARWDRLRVEVQHYLLTQTSVTTVLRRWCNNQVRKRSYLQRWPLVRPMTIVFLGPDGAGKSTIGQELKSDFDATYIYMGGRGATLPTTRFIKWVANRKKISQASPASRQKQSRESIANGRTCTTSTPVSTGRRPSVGTTLKNLTTRPAIRIHSFGEYLARYFTAITSSANTPVVFDRYVYDQVVWATLLPADHHRTLLNSALSFSYLHFFPSPDHLIVLDAPAEILQRRKPEHSVESLDAVRQGYLDFVTNQRPNSTTASIVSTAEDSKMSLDEVKRSILKAKLHRRRVRNWI